MGYIYPPKIVQVNILWGNNDVRTVIELFIPPQNKFLATPLADTSVSVVKERHLDCGIAFYERAAATFLR